MVIKRTDKNTTPLRQEAEAQLAHVPQTEALTDPAGELLHELQVHQIELEMQNEQLRQAQTALEESRDRYVDLYEFAPVGYLTLTDTGMISEINLTGTTLLKTERNKLLHHRFNPFVAPEHRDRWNRLFVSVLQRDERQSCELSLQRGDGSALHAQLDCLRLAKDGKPPVVRITLTDITLLRESEEKFKAIFDSAKDGILLADMEDKKLLLGNTAACRMLGYTAEEINKLHVMDIHPENDLPYVLSEFEKQARGNKVVAENIPVKRKDGSVFYAEITTTHLNIGGKTCLAGFFRDITERKQAEDSLRKLSLAVEQSPSSIIITDLDANIEYANAAFVKTTGYSLAEAIGQNPRMLHSGKTPKATYDDLWAHLTRGEAWKGEFINRRKDGSEYIESVLFSPVRQADGRVTNYLAIKEDITQSRRAQEALRVSRENLHRLLNSMAEGVYGVDTNGNCIFVNLAFLQMLGYQNENEVLGKHIHELIHHSHADGSPYPERECRAYRAYRTNQLSHVSDEMFWRKDGVAIPVEYWSHPIVSDGVVTGAIVTFVVIAERKLAEAILTEQVEELSRWHDATMGREMRVLDLKHEVNELLGQAGQPPRYPSAEPDDPE
ncbi:MAG: PAS domain S-box protein [Gallionella sp.]|nr:PAS domain S-box protein [Gallionella sp.]